MRHFKCTLRLQRKFLVRVEACTAAWYVMIDIHVMLTQDSDLTAKMKDGDTDALAAQNQYLKEALETCRTQILELTQQVH